MVVLVSEGIGEEDCDDKDAADDVVMMMIGDGRPLPLHSEGECRWVELGSLAQKAVPAPLDLCPLASVSCYNL